MERKINRLSNDTWHDEFNLINKLVSSIKVVQFCNIYIFDIEPYLIALRIFLQSNHNK